MINVYSFMRVLGLALALTGLARSGVARCQLPAAQEVISSEHEIDLPSEAGVPFGGIVPLDGVEHFLWLEPHSLRSPRFQVLVPGSEATDASANCPTRTYRGSIDGMPGSRVAAVIDDRGLHALVLAPSGVRAWSIEPTSHSSVRSAPVYVASRFDLGDDPVTCRVRERGPASPARSEELGSQISLGAMQRLEIACDTDVQYFIAQGSSVPNTVASIEGILTFTSLIYEEHFNVVLSIGTIIVRAQEPDPYPALPQDHPFQMDLYLGYLEPEWNTNQQSVQRDTTQMFSNVLTQSMIFGIADGYGNLCNAPESYSIVRPGSYSTLPTRGMLSAHELGHLFSAHHCGGSGCGIMIPGGYPNIPHFGPTESAEITAFISTASCLSADGAPSPAPTLSAVSPGHVPVLDGGTITLTGSNFDHVLRVVTNGTTLYATEFTLVNASTISYLATEGTVLGPGGVRVSGPGGTSQIQRFGYIEVDPPKILSLFDPVSLTPDGANTWKFASKAGREARLLRSNDATTSMENGWPVLTNGSVVQTTILDSRGIGSYTTIVPGNTNPPTFYLQIAVYSGGVLVGSSNVLYNHVGF